MKEEVSLSEEMLDVVLDKKLYLRGGDICYAVTHQELTEWIKRTRYLETLKKNYQQVIAKKAVSTHIDQPS